MTSAPCPDCGAIGYLQDETCWRCTATVVPGCPHCRHPVEPNLLARGVCFYCGMAVNAYALVRPWTTTR